MREIEFRGQRVDNGEWVCGLPRFTKYFPEVEITAIEDENGNVYEDVKPETISQFTGLLDKNGNKIFEGDILISTIYADDEAKKMRVIYQKDCASFRLVSCNDNEKWSMAWADQNEIIGNIHEDGDK